MKLGARSEEVQAPAASPKPKEGADKEEAEKETKAQLDSSEERDDYLTWFKAYLNHQYDKAVELLEKQISEGGEEIDRISLQTKVGIIKY